jgi:Protein of unknown function (DUF3293)
MQVFAAPPDLASGRFPVTRQTAAVYLTTEYVLRERGYEWVITVGRRLPTVERGLSRHHARCGVFVTAWNPHGRRLDRSHNVRAQMRLRARLRAGAWRFAEGCGRGRNPGWSPEPSLLVFGMNRRLAAALGRQLRQNAVVFASRSRPAELMALR